MSPCFHGKSWGLGQIHISLGFCLFAFKIYIIQNHGIKIIKILGYKHEKATLATCIRKIYLGGY